MTIIRVMNKNILISLRHQAYFKSLKKYIVSDEEYEYSISSSGEIIPIPKMVPALSTTFYDIYEMDGYRLQIQKDLGNIIGAIRYEGNNITIYPYVDEFATEYLLSQYAMVYIITKNKGILFHGSSFIYKNKGIILTAKSGTGKSTHSRLWQKNEDIIVVNDDKNIICVEDSKVCIYSSPWSGKHMLDNNVKTTLDAIVFLYQNDVNVVEDINPSKAFRMLLGQIDMPNEKNSDFWNEITDHLLDLPIIQLGCNMEVSAYKTLKKSLEEKLCL